ncbi:MAG: hypothetical protein B6244_02935 [Candidatus Cloacimonetes bacterium 4572_55]|nr:MAG: hypothetical protein B6244_02935 [Candidatus Cloacimonetes bacterium 4572_55]
MLKKIKIEKLFGDFDYEMELKKGGVTILTGPNGYGKTTILKILHAFFTKNTLFFSRISFRNIILSLEKKEIRVFNSTGDVHTSSALIQIEGYDPPTKALPGIKENIPPPSNRPSEYRHSVIFRWEIENKPPYESEMLRTDAQIKEFKESMPDIGDAYFIGEQRIIKFSSGEKRFSLSIEEYAKELAGEIAKTFDELRMVSQRLDMSFPKRLINESNRISEEDFDERYKALRKKQKLLNSYGMSVIEGGEVASFSEDDAKVLLIYLSDMEKRLAVFDDILEKLDIFSNILNKKDFSQKRVKITPKYGFFWEKEGMAEKETGEKGLPLKNLSSGEQQQAIFWYELIFKAHPGTLVLIDEPETSLHIVWQKEVINDLLKIAELRDLSIIVTTHSPYIIAEHWNLTVDLWDLHSGEITE